MMKIKSHLMRTTVPNCYKWFIEEADKFRTFEKFVAAIDGLYEEYRAYLDLAGRLTRLQDVASSEPIDTVNKYFKAALLSQLPGDFDGIVYNFYEYSFRVFSGFMSQENDLEMDELEMKDEFSCSTCDAELAGGCKCSSILKSFNETNRKLGEMDILDRLCGRTIDALVEEKIESSTKEMCQGMLRSNVSLLENWLDGVVFEWFKQVYQTESIGPEGSKRRNEEMLDNFKVKLEFFLCETYARIIIDQFFNIIIGEY